MKIKWSIIAMVIMIATVLSGCEPLMVLDPKGPQAARQARDILLSIGIMSVVGIIVFAILIFILIKYRASKMGNDYEPPHIEGNTWVEAICVGIPILIVAYFSFVSVQSNYIVESAPKGYDNEPLVIYASSSDWKWHFSYPEEGIETVNYLNIPTDRPLEFRLYSYGPITSFWIPQLGGQKYAMSDMITTLHLAADEVGEYMGRNANFSGKGFAENMFDVKAMTQADFDDWVNEVKEREKPLTEEKFEELLKPGHLGRMTFTGTHLEFMPPPGDHSEHNKKSNKSNEEHDEHSSESESSMDHSEMNMDHSDH
ncbi:cytochrome aa3 quinol oxidase subunit II [Fredinandcohnia quinoae]|uniref:Quinol oxidase subunit 2 n=1 Tax=Fredinandcohnia quinoae TaxID=2918902 RepID=A0AAW5DVD3_9BACI|nr:cytochrome aa3 quinol oxidase subunit II [Fredinandcohnia sp. SECRCQ15]MCH1624308.1 cytochrome aa3 quinol oxidase subunit II [Fredinandcohnia sp. SECRCQ15]